MDEVVAILIVAAIPFAAFLLIRARLRATKAERREANGACGSCGYDLRASHLRCPECGTRISYDQACDLALRRNRATETFVGRPMDTDELPIGIYASSDELEIDRLKTQLRLRGIKCDVASHLPLFPREKLILRVGACDEDRARVIIEYLQGTGQIGNRD